MNIFFKTYIRSNNQGYLKGDDLLIGIPTSSANLTAISVLFPFSFYRFDENGYCYQENNNLTKLEDQDVN